MGSATLFGWGGRGQIEATGENEHPSFADLFCKFFCGQQRNMQQESQFCQRIVNVSPRTQPCCKKNFCLQKMFWMQPVNGQFWMFSFENYADQSLDRRQKLIGMRLGMRFFIYGMNGSKILLQMHMLMHGLTSHAKTTGIWPGMLPLYLHIGGFNVCYRGILLVLVAWAVHDILGNPNFMRIAGTQIWDHGENWTTSCGTHI